MRRHRVLYDAVVERVFCSLFAALAVLLAHAAVRAEGVAIVAAGERDRAVVDYLMTQVEGTAVVRSSERARDPKAVMDEAEDWSEELIVIIDTEQRVVRVVRVSDGTILSRVLELLVAERSPYAVSVAAVELLELAGHAPQKPEPEPELEPTPEPAPVVDRPEVPVEPTPPVTPAPQRLEPGFAFTAGALLTASTGGDVSLVQPSLGGDVQLAVEPTPWLLSVGLRTAGVLGRERVIVPAATTARLADATVDYDRAEVLLRMSAGRREGPAAALGYAAVGVAFISVSGTGKLPDRGPARDEVVGEVERQVLWLGAGAELRYRFAGGFGLSLDVGGGFQPASARYTVEGSSAFDEGNAYVRGGLMVFWESP